MLALDGRRRAADLLRRRALLGARRTSAGGAREPGRDVGSRRARRARSGRSSRCRSGSSATAPSGGRGGLGRGSARSRSLGGAAQLLLLALIVPRDVAALEASTSWNPEWPTEFPGVLPDRTTTASRRDNAQRNPQRTASTAAALMIGLALVTLVAVLASGHHATFRGAVDDLFDGGLRDHGAEQLLADSDQRRGSAPRRRRASRRSRRSRRARRACSTRRSRSRPSTRHAAGARRWSGRRDRTPSLALLGRDGAFVDDGLRGGPPPDASARRSRADADRQDADLVVKGSSSQPTGGSPFGRSRSRRDVRRELRAAANLFTFVQMRGGETDANTAALDQALAARSRTRRRRRRSSSWTTRSRLSSRS